MRRLLLFAAGLGPALLAGPDTVALGQPALAPPPPPAAALSALSADDLVRQGVAAETRMDPKAALELFRLADLARPGDAFILQEIARQLSDCTSIATTDKEKERLASEGLGYAQRAVALAPKDPVNVLSVAICYGKLALTADTRKKIEYSRQVKKFAEEALALNPDYDWAHHVLARWNYEVATLGFADRIVVRLVYGGLPSASLDQAITHFSRAIALAPNEPSHHIELGFAYLAAKRPADARKEFNTGLGLPSREVFDTGAKNRATAALAKLK